MAQRKPKPIKIESIRTKVVFVHPAEDRELLRQLAKSCRRTAELYRLYQNLPRKKLGTLFREMPWATREGESGDPPTVTIELPVDQGHLSPAHMFHDIIIRPFPGGFDPKKIQELTFDSLLVEMGNWCERFAKRRRGPLRNTPLRWLIADIRERYWNGHKGPGVYWNEYKAHYQGAFLDVMKKVLEEMSYPYGSSDALAQTILAVWRKRKKSLPLG